MAKMDLALLMNRAASASIPQATLLRYTNQSTTSVKTMITYQFVNLGFIVVHFQSDSDCLLRKIEWYLVKVKNSVRLQGDISSVVEIFEERWHSSLNFQRYTDKAVPGSEKKISLIESNSGGSSFDFKLVWDFTFINHNAFIALVALNARSDHVLESFLEIGEWNAAHYSINAGSSLRKPNFDALENYFIIYLFDSIHISFK